MGLDGDADEGEGGTLVEPGLSGELVVRDMPRLDKGLRVGRSGEDREASLSPYNEVGRRLGTDEEESGEFGTVV